MKLKFLDSNNVLRTLILDANVVSESRQQLKRGKKLYGEIYGEKLEEYAKTISELDIQRKCSDYNPSKNTKEEGILACKELCGQYDAYIESIMPKEDIKYIYYCEWDENAIYNKNNRSNNPEEESSIKKLLGFAALKKIAKECGLSEVDDDGEHVDEGVEKITFIGKKSDFNNFFNQLADKFTEAEKIFSGKEYTNYKANEVEELKLVELEPSLKELKNKIAEIKSYLEENNSDIAEKDTIINNPNSSEQEKLEAEEDRADIEFEKEENETELNQLEKTYSKTLSMVKKNFNNGKYDPKLVEEVSKKIDKRFEPHTYTAEEILKYCDGSLDHTGLIKADYNFVDSKPINDSNPTWFGIENAKFNFDYDRSTLTVDGKTYNYMEINDTLIKTYKDSKLTCSIEEWMKENPKLVKNIINNFKSINEEGEKTMAKDALKNLKFKFADGTTIEVLESDGKDFASIKDEAIKVYKELKKNAKDTNLVEKAEKETEEVLEDFGAKATNDSCKDDELETKEVLEEYNAPATNDSIIDKEVYESAKKAFDDGKTLKEWFAEEGKDLVDGDSDIAKKENAISVWRYIKNEAEAKDPKEEEKELSEDEQWDIAYKNMDYTDSVDTDDVKIEDEIEEKEAETTEETAQYEVVINGKQIGVYATLEEAEEAEKKALEAIEKGIPKPTEDCDI